jgi:hypothetical protein
LTFSASSINNITTPTSGSVGHLNDHGIIKTVLKGHDDILTSAALLGNSLSGDATGYVSGAKVVFSASPTLTSPLIANSALINNPLLGATEFDGKALSFTVNSTASSRGPVAVNLFTSNTGATTLLNVATAQNIFPSTNQTINLAANTTYEMEMWFSISTTGATSNLLSLGFAIGGTLTSIGYMVHVTQNATSAVTITAANNLWIATNTSTAITAAAVTATYRNVFVKGIVRSGTTGTFIPQITYSAAPGAAPVVAPNAYIKLTPLASDTALSSTAWHA